MWENFIKNLYDSLIADERWRFYLEGIKNTLLMSVLACMLGILLGLLIAVIKVSHTQTGRLKFPAILCDLYVTVIRGTPVTIQLLILYYVVITSAPASGAVYVAALAFGLNSAAYISEIVRAGIQSIERGQMEAGRSLGLSQRKTMVLIILPQALRNILPALFNEFITLIKETSVAGFISVNDVTRAGDLIRTRTFLSMPLFISAGIYLAMVIGLTMLQRRLERRLATGDKR